ncbi:hypothetical protein PsorP6_005927 [Peronosclerospora sorghi]|uniref:Uncharacterized protein n=1 Tax=Peronosclerospora sorghi TaxID=230839 RepID=A0ACC0W1A9_9STRA|nr:hypothetical protein PsorP6_005927 [Peronosclerospora sorghi]
MVTEWNLAQLFRWLCEQHNIVNRKLNKPVFVCTMENLEERWRKGKPSCWDEGDDEDSAQEALE